METANCVVGMSPVVREQPFPLALQHCSSLWVRLAAWFRVVGPCPPHASMNHCRAHWKNSTLPNWGGVLAWTSRNYPDCCWQLACFWSPLIVKAIVHPVPWDIVGWGFWALTDRIYTSWHSFAQKVFAPTTIGHTSQLYWLLPAVSYARISQQLLSLPNPFVTF